MPRTPSIFKPDPNIDAVCANDIMTGAIESRHIANEEIENKHLADDAVDTDQIADDAVDTDQIADSAVEAAQVADGVLLPIKAANVTSNVAIPVAITYDVTTGAADIKIFNADAPFKFEILDVIVQPRGASTNGTIKITNGTNDITNAMVCAVDQTMVRAGTIDNAYSTIAASGTLQIVCAGDTPANTIGLVTVIAQRVA